MTEDGEERKIRSIREPVRADTSIFRREGKVCGQSKIQ